MRAAAKVAIPLLDAASSGIGFKWSQFAYLLATAEHESNFGGNSREIWGPTADQLSYEPVFDRYGRNVNQKAIDLGNNFPGDGYRYRGRGYVQITGRGNYARFTKILPTLSGITYDLEANPASAALPEIAAIIAVQGIQNDLFTGGGRKLDDVIGTGTMQEFLNARSFIGARYVRRRVGKKIRKVDVRLEIANRALDFLAGMAGTCF